MGGAGAGGAVGSGGSGSGGKAGLGGAAGGTAGGAGGSVGAGGAGGQVVGGRGGAGGGGGSAECVVTGISVDSGAGPFLTVSPMYSIDFLGKVGVSSPGVFTLSNLGSAASGAFTVTLTGASSFQITGDSCTALLPAGKSCQVAVTYSPLTATGAGEDRATLAITAVGIPGCTYTLSLFGTAN